MAALPPPTSVFVHSPMEHNRNATGAGAATGPKANNNAEVAFYSTAGCVLMRSTLAEGRLRESCHPIYLAADGVLLLLHILANGIRATGWPGIATGPHLPLPSS